MADKEVVIQLTEEQRNQIKTVTGRDIRELKVGTVDDRANPLAFAEAAERTNPMRIDEAEERANPLAFAEAAERANPMKIDDVAERANPTQVFEE